MKAAAAARADGEEGGGGGNDENGDVAAAAAKPARKKRAPADAQYFVDFARPADVNWDEAFAPPKRGNTKLTKSSKEKAKLLTTVLPADVHYGPNVLMSLFTKPKWMIPKQILSWRPIVDPAAQGQVPLAVAEGELELARPHEEQQEGSATAWFNNAALVDEPPASQQQQQQFGGLLDDDDFDNGGYGDELMYGEGGEPLSASQQQHEQQQRAMASARKSMAFAGPMVFEVGGVQREFLVAEPQRVEQIALHHAKAVRAVDVKMLKASIWRSLNLPAARRDSAAAASEQPNPAAPEVQSFQELLDVLPSRIPRFEQSNVTIPFCFISLLHLANERGLELRSDGLDNLEIVQH
jgi:condensin complex subunit 2